MVADISSIRLRSLSYAGVVLDHNVLALIITQYDVASWSDRWSDDYLHSTEDTGYRQGVGLTTLHLENR